MVHQIYLSLGPSFSLLYLFHFVPSLFFVILHVLAYTVTTPTDTESGLPLGGLLDMSDTESVHSPVLDPTNRGMRQRVTTTQRVVIEGPKRHPSKRTPNSFQISWVSFRDQSLQLSTSGIPTLDSHQTLDG